MLPDGVRELADAITEPRRDGADRTPTYTPCGGSRTSAPDIGRGGSVDVARVAPSTATADEAVHERASSGICVSAGAQRGTSDRAADDKRVATQRCPAGVTRGRTPGQHGIRQPIIPSMLPRASLGLEPPSSDASMVAAM